MKIQVIPTIIAGGNLFALVWILMIAPSFRPDFDEGEARTDESFERLDVLTANPVEEGSPEHRELRRIQQFLRSDFASMKQVWESAFALSERVGVALFFFGVFNFLAWIGFAFTRRSPPIRA